MAHSPLRKLPAAPARAAAEEHVAGAADQDDADVGAETFGIDYVGHDGAVCHGLFRESRIGRGSGGGRESVHGGSGKTSLFFMPPTLFQCGTPFSRRFGNNALCSRTQSSHQCWL